MRPPNRHRTRRASGNRRGATLLELAVVLLPFLVLTLGMIDLGLGVFRYHIVANAARQAARRAIVHGAQAVVLGPWGPTKINVTADATGTAIVDGNLAGYPDGIQPMLVGCDLAKTTITIEWLDASNALGKRVRATVASPYTPVTLLFLGSVTLHASSTLQIAH
jgi:Flp pilus assembly protein TadG